MSLEPFDEPFRLTPEQLERLPEDVDPVRLEYFLSLLAPADRDGFLEFAMRGRPGVPTVPKRTDSVPQPERVVYLEMVSRPRGVHFSDPEMNAAWQAVFRRDD